MSEMPSQVIRMPRLVVHHSSLQLQDRRVLAFPVSMDVRDAESSPLEDPLPEFPIPPQAELRDSCLGCGRSYSEERGVLYCRNTSCRYDGQTHSEILSQSS